MVQTLNKNRVNSVVAIGEKKAKKILVHLVVEGHGNFLHLLSQIRS